MEEVKFHVVIKGWKTGIFSSKEEYKHNILNFSGAKASSFANREDAVAWFMDNRELSDEQPLKHATPRPLTPLNLIPPLRSGTPNLNLDNLLKPTIQNERSALDARMDKYLDVNSQSKIIPKTSGPQTIIDDSHAIQLLNRNRIF
jgi:hypothetical protein